MQILETPRLVLRPLLSSDVDSVLEILGDPVAMQFYPATLGRGEAAAWIARQQRYYDVHGHGLWAAELKDSGRFAGQVGLVPQEVDETLETEIGYLLVREFWGRGLATEAAAACRDYGFSHLQRKRLISLIDVRNLPSVRVAERIGMTRERELIRWDKPVYLYAATKVGTRFR